MSNQPTFWFMQSNCIRIYIVFEPVNKNYRLMSKLIVCRACTRTLSVTMFVHLQWTQKQIMHGNIWGFLWGILNFKAVWFTCLTFKCSCMKFVYNCSCASRNDMLEACDSRNIDVLQKEFPLWLPMLPREHGMRCPRQKFWCQTILLNYYWWKSLTICRLVLGRHFATKACKSFEDEAKIDLAPIFQLYFSFVDV